MTFADEVSDMRAEVYGALGGAAIYTLGADPPIPCNVRLWRNPQQQGMDGITFSGGYGVAQIPLYAMVRAAEVPAPVEGGVFTPGRIVAGVFVPGSRSYRIAAAPVGDDAQDSVWRCPVDPGEGG